MARTRIAVVGVGHLGKHHARLLDGIDEAELCGVVDLDLDAARQVAALYGVDASTDYRELLGKIDAVCVVVPTVAHREVAGYFLENGIDVLVEKPITPTEAEGRELVAIAKDGGRILQVGHVERFNPALRAIDEFGIEPRYVEAQRHAPFTFRSVDIGVVLDLMVHDLDLILSLIRSPVESVEAFGGAVFTEAEDMANATIRFANGAVAQLTANRIALKPMRKLRAFSRDSYLSVDLQAAKGLVIRKGPGWDLNRLDLRTVDTSQIDDLWKYVFEGLLQIKEYSSADANPLRDELCAFLSAVRDRTRPVVTGEDGCDVLAVAHRVLEAIRRNPW